MRYLTEFRDADVALRVAAEIKSITKGNWALMEVCGGQTHSIIKNGIDQLLPESVELIHGPGCPVCVTPLEVIDRALAIAATPDVIFCSFGDMLRVPGSSKDLFQIKSEGGDIRIVYSPLDAVKIAQDNPTKRIVFFAIGFETTAPANAMSVKHAAQLGLTNYFVLTSHVLVPPAMEAILAAPDNRVQAFLAAGHVCSVMGYWQYHPIAAQHRVPIIVTGFEPLDVLDGIRRAIIQLENGESYVENAYTRIVNEQGNAPAQAVLSEVFEISDQTWRGIGRIPRSGMTLRAKYAAFDATRAFDVNHITAEESKLCHSGDVLQGRIKPHQCPAFGRECTPRKPLGATMVSSEGACAAYYNNGRFLPVENLTNA